MKIRPGLTLVDLIVALAILAIVMTAVYGVFSFLQTTGQAASEGREACSQGLVVLDRMSRDLSGAWLPPDWKSSRIVYQFEGGARGLNLDTTSGYSLDNQPGPEIVEVGYRVEDTSDPEGRLRLFRRQDDTPDDDPEEGGNEILLTSDLLSLEIIYLGLDGMENPSWSSEQAGSLPAYIRITMEIAGESGNREKFMTLVDLPVSQPKIVAPKNITPGLTF